MFNKLLTLVRKDDLVKQNTILFAGTMTLNILNYVYHFLVGRLLGPADYGILGAFFSIIYILFAPVNTIQTTLAKFTANFAAKNETGKVVYIYNRALKLLSYISLVIFFIFFIIFFKKNKSENVVYIYNRALKLLSYISLVIFFIFFIFSPQIGKFLLIDNINYVRLFSLVFLIVFVTAVSRGFLQGLQKFEILSAALIIEGCVKLSLASILIYFSFNLYGALTAISVALLVSFLFAFYFLKKN